MARGCFHQSAWNHTTCQNANMRIMLQIVVDSSKSALNHTTPTIVVVWVPKPQLQKPFQLCRQQYRWGIFFFSPLSWKHPTLPTTHFHWFCYQTAVPTTIQVNCLHDSG
jgi:hypothetical protein